MTEYSSWLRPGKLMPKLVLRPYTEKRPYWFDNRCYVYSWPSTLILIDVAFILVLITGLWLMTGAFLTGAKWAYILGTCLMLIGGGGSILSGPLHRVGSVDVFDRVNGLLRASMRPKKGEKGSPWVMREFPFHECEARLTRMDNPLRASILHGLTIYHPSFKYAVLSTITFAERDHALGFWSFLLQYMDKEAPLPDMMMLRPWPNRTRGLGKQDAWEEVERNPDFIDPMEVWLGYWKKATAEDCKEIYDLYEPRNMQVDCAPAPPDRDPCHQIEARDDDTPLPGRLLRPFVNPKPFRLDDKQYHYNQHNPDNKYYYLVSWMLFCAGLGSFGFSTSVAWTGLVAAGGFLAAFIKFRRKRGTTFDREKGQVVFHQGLRFTPLRLPFDKLTGRLIKINHYEGYTSYKLNLHHPRHGSFNLDGGRFRTLDHLLGFWSFIVQYMDKTAPLPEVPDLAEENDLAKGLGTWDSWAEKTLAEDFIDPFEKWQSELAANTSADAPQAANEDDRQSRAGRMPADPTGQSAPS